MKLAFKIASSALATISLVFFLIQYFGSYYSYHGYETLFGVTLGRMSRGGIESLDSFFSFSQFWLFALAFIFLEIGIWMKGTGLRNASLILSLIATILMLTSWIFFPLMYGIDSFYAGMVAFILSDTFYLAVCITLLATKRRCGVGSIIVNGILITIYIILCFVPYNEINYFATYGLLAIAQLLMNIAVSPLLPENRSAGYAGIQQGGYAGIQQGGYVGIQQGGYPGIQQGGYPGMQQGGYPGMQQGTYPGNYNGNNAGNSYERVPTDYTHN